MIGIASQLVTISEIITPGAIAICGYVRMNDRPSASIPPHDGVGGWAPNPRNESAASSKMMPPTPRLAITMTGLKTLGMMWRKMMRALLAPAA